MRNTPGDPPATPCLSRRLIDLAHYWGPAAALAGCCAIGILLAFGVTSWAQVGAALVWTGIGLQFLVAFAWQQADVGDIPLHLAIAPYIASWALVFAGLPPQADRFAPLARALAAP